MPLFLHLKNHHSKLSRNMKSIGIDLQTWVEKGLLRFHATRPTLYGLETHLVNYT